jgi:hypothetical protein
MTARLDPAIKLQRWEERICECGAAGSGECHSGDWCPAEPFDHIPRRMTAARALRWLKAKHIRWFAKQDHD